MYIDALLIVEGNADKAYISSLVDINIVTTNGLDIPKDELIFIKEVSKTKKIYVLTDPDEAGENIRERIHKQVPNSIDLRIKSDNCHKGHKKGVAECDKDVIINLFKTLESNNQRRNDEITAIDLYECGLLGKNNSKELRKEVSLKYRLGKCNAKTMIDRLNLLGINKNELKDLWK